MSGAIRAVLAGPPADAVSTFVRDSSHFAGAVTVRRERPEWLRDDPFSRLGRSAVLIVAGGLFGRLAAIPGPVIQRYSGKPGRRRGSSRSHLHAVNDTPNKATFPASYDASTPPAPELGHGLARRRAPRDGRRRPTGHETNAPSRNACDNPFDVVMVGPGPAGEPVAGGCADIGLSIALVESLFETYGL